MLLWHHCFIRLLCTPDNHLSSFSLHPLLTYHTQRFQAALAFDAVQFELPGIKESDVDPSDLVDKVS